MRALIAFLVVFAMSCAGTPAEEPKAAPEPVAEEQVVPCEQNDPPDCDVEAVPEVDPPAAEAVPAEG